jgi:soluble cytochrome b562
MSVSGISTSGFFEYDSENVQNEMQQVQKEFQQLGQDLQSGNLTAAQTDLVTLQNLGAPGTSTSSSSSSSTQYTNPVAQAYSQLSQDLQSGNLSAAQQDYATIQQDLQQQASPMHHHHHHHGGSGNDSDAISQLFDELGQDLQSGNLTGAQQAYSTLEQDLGQSSQNSGTVSDSSSTSSS